VSVQPSRIRSTETYIGLREYRYSPDVTSCRDGNGEGHDAGQREKGEQRAKKHDAC
jgi:hypothetical protein